MTNKKLDELLKKGGANMVVLMYINNKINLTEKQRERVTKLKNEGK